MALENELPGRRGSGPTFALIIPPVSRKKKKNYCHISGWKSRSRVSPPLMPSLFNPPFHSPIPPPSLFYFLPSSPPPPHLSRSPFCLPRSPSHFLPPLFYSSSHTPSSVSFTTWEVKRKRRKRKDRRIYGGGELQIKRERQKRKDVLSHPICVSETEDMNPEPPIQQTDANQ